MRTIPKRFSVLGNEITVEWRDDLIAKHDAWGLCHFHEHRIELQSPTEEIKIAPSHLMQSFLHEFFHMGLYCLGRTDMSMDEELVDQLGQIVHQLLKSKSNK